jgi:hypothetical protein
VRDEVRLLRRGWDHSPVLSNVGHSSERARTPSSTASLPCPRAPRASDHSLRTLPRLETTAVRRVAGHLHAARHRVVVRAVAERVTRPTARTMMNVTDSTTATTVRMHAGAALMALSEWCAAIVIRTMRIIARTRTRLGAASAMIGFRTSWKRRHDRSTDYFGVRYRCVR